jgi:hypothetical protein
MINIPKQLWCIINPDREDNLAYMTHYEENASFEKRKSTGTHWATPRTRKNKETGLYEPAKIPVEKIIDNSPIKGIYIGSSVSRWSTSNKLFRVNDPRGFTVEVPTDNIATLLHLTTVEHGVVQEECVWGREGNNHIILPVNSEPYLETLDKMDTLANKLIKVGDLKPGDVVKFFEDDREHTYIGRGKITWKIKPYTHPNRNNWRASYEERNEKQYSSGSEFDYTGSSYVNIFTYEYSNSKYKGTDTHTNPRIVEILKNVDIDRNSINLSPHWSALKHIYPYDSEVISIKWKE